MLATPYKWFPSLLQLFTQQQPGCNVDIRVEATRQALPYLLRGELDVAFVNSLPNSPKLHVDVLFSDE